MNTAVHGPLERTPDDLVLGWSFAPAIAMTIDRHLRHTQDRSWFSRMI